MNHFKIIAEGKLACFTRPELKVERVTYDVPTPGAIEGMLKCIYWKPAIRYVIDKIIIFNPINTITIRRNEVNNKISCSKIRQQMKNPDIDISIYTGDCRTQRYTTFLKKVKYGIEFHIELTGIRCEEENKICDPMAKHCGIMKRRLEKGERFRTPYFGCSECTVDRIVPVEDFDMSQIAPEIRRNEDIDLGYMLYRMRFFDGGVPVNLDWKDPIFADEADAVYYRPHIKRGIIDVAHYAEGIKC